MRFPELRPLTLDGLILFYQALSFRIGVIFVARAWGDFDAMPAVVYGNATDHIGPRIWALMFCLVHLGAFLSVLMKQYGAAMTCCCASVMIYVLLGISSNAAPGGLVVEEFSIGLHAAMQALVAYEVWRRWLDDGG